MTVYTATLITAKAVMYPPAAYIAILTGCCILAAMSVAAALRIRETFGKSIYGEYTDV